MKTDTPLQQVVNHYLFLKDLDQEEVIYARYVKDAKEILDITNSIKKAKELLDRTKEWAESRGLEWGMETSVKRYLEL